MELLDRGLLSVREYELLKQHILTDLLSTALGWPSTAQDQGRGGGRPLEDAGSFTAMVRVDSDKAKLQTRSAETTGGSAETTGGSDNGITNLESAGSQLQQERVPSLSV